MTINTNHSTDTLTPTGGTLNVAGGVGLTTALPIASGGTGATTANDAVNALLPSQTGNNGKVLSTDGSNTSWTSVGGTGTVTSVSGTGTVSGISLSGTVTSAGSLTLGGALDLSSPPAIGGTTPAAGTFTNVEATGGVLADGSFSGTYVDGIVMDYTTGAGRISVGGTDDLNFYNGGVAGSLLGHASSNGNWGFHGFIEVGVGSMIAGATNPLIAASASSSNYVQGYIHNDQNGTSSSADLTCYPNNGVDASGWIDMGITSQTYADTTYTCTGPNEGYLFMSAPSGSSTTGNLVYATDSTGSQNYHKWYTGGFTQTSTAWKMQLRGTALDLAVPLNSTVATGTAPFTVASTTQVANLNAATAGTATTATNATNVAITGATSTNASFYPTFVAANSTSNQGLDTTGSFSINPSTGLVSAQSLSLAAGTTSQAPLDFVAGTNLTTAAAGAMEYDGNTPYFSIAASTRGVMTTEQVIILNATNTLTSQTAVQPIFDGGGGPTNGSVTLPIGTYFFECSFALTGMSATSGSFGFALGGAATKTYAYNANASKGTGTSLTTASATTATFNTGAQTTLNTAGTGTAGTAMIKGTIRVTVAGTVIPQVSLTVASAAVIQAGSYFRVSPISNSGTTVSVGNWA